MTQHSIGKPITFRIGREELILRDRYEIASICNDILIGVIFLVGSFLFFSDSTTYAGTWLFVVGSAFMLIRPGIRLTRRIHLQRVNPGADSAVSRDF